MTPPDRAPDRVTYGGAEPTGFGYRTWEDRPSVAQVLFGAHNWQPVIRERWARKCYEVWEEPQRPIVVSESDDEMVFGYSAPKTIGRWYWVPEPRYQPAGSPPLPQTCVRDTLEDEMGYEVATRFIGHREAAMGFPL